MTAAEIENSESFKRVLRRQCLALLAIQAADPRSAGIFATQQRWLLAHIALMIFYRSQTLGNGEHCRSSNFLATVAEHGVASRNTADAFLKEMLKYGYIAAVPGSGDRRVRPFAVTALGSRPLEAWLCIHLTSLDELDGGERLPRFLARPELIARIHPRIANGLLQSSAVRMPAPTFSLFTWLNEGGVMMDWIYAGLEDPAPGADLIPTQVRSYADFSERIRLSRSQLARKLRAAETMGSLVWAGARGASAMSVSPIFVREYEAQQSAKLAVIDDAFAFVADHGHV